VFSIIAVWMVLLAAESDGQGLLSQALRATLTGNRQALRRINRRHPRDDVKPVGPNHLPMLIMPTPSKVRAPGRMPAASPPLDPDTAAAQLVVAAPSSMRRGF
jgi:hypothetical protein